MAKDPAFLFYYQDFLVGTTFMSAEEKGYYITILCHQADKHSLPETKILELVPSDIWLKIRGKFTIDVDGNFYNKRLREEHEKRKAWCESRSDNRLLGWNKIKGPKPRKAKKISAEFEDLWKEYPKPVGKKMAQNHFNASVKDGAGLINIKQALNNYKNSSEVTKGFIMNGDKWFNNWEDWVNIKTTQAPDGTPNEWKTKENLLRRK